MRELQPLVTDIELSKLLQKANIKHYCSLYWYYNDKKDMPFWEVMYLPWLSKDHGLELFPAYTAQDLIYALPDDIWFKKQSAYTTIKTSDNSLIIQNDTNLAVFLARVILNLKKSE